MVDGRTRTGKIVNQLKKNNSVPQKSIKEERQDFGGMFIPNHSGDHSAGHVNSTPVNDTDLVNKKYVDDNSFSSPLTTKGDIHVYSTTDTRLPIGTNDYVLTADSTQTTGMKWAAASAGGLAMKQYIGTVSGGGGDFTVSVSGATLSSVIRCVAIPYQTSDGAWRLKFNCAIVLSVADLSFDLHFSGVTYKDVSNFNQPVSIYSNAGGWLLAKTNNGDDWLDIDAETATDFFSVSGDVELDSKPTWAD